MSELVGRGHGQACRLLEESRKIFWDITARLMFCCGLNRQFSFEVGTSKHLSTLPIYIFLFDWSRVARSLLEDSFFQAIDSVDGFGSGVRDLGDLGGLADAHSMHMN